VWTCGHLGLYVFTLVTVSVDHVAVTKDDDGYEFASLLKSSEIL